VRTKRRKKHEKRAKLLRVESNDLFRNAAMLLSRKGITGDVEEANDVSKFRLQSSIFLGNRKRTLQKEKHEEAGVSVDFMY
jgi:hypothetical protein